MGAAESHDHVRLRDAYGAPASELVPAERLSVGTYRVIGTPGLIHGCAAGDEIAVDSDGNFTVLKHGGNVAVHIYAGTPIRAQALASLQSGFAAIGGLVEVPADSRFAVVTVPVDAGFPVIEEAMYSWIATVKDVEWSFGNVYDEDDQPLNWWAQ